MDHRDKTQLAVWLRTGATLAEVETTAHLGLVGNTRFTNQAVRAYKLIWTWSAARFSGLAGISQERLYDRCGPEVLQRRMARAQRFASDLVRRF